MTVLIVVGIIAMPLLVWSIISPRSQWQLLSGWKYRNREANEPSDAAYTVARLGSAVLLVALIAAWFQLGSADAERTARDDLFASLPSAGHGSKVVSVEQVDDPTGSTSIVIVDHVAVDDDTAFVQSPPDGIGQIPEGTDLLLAVPFNPDFKPVVAHVDESPSKVTVTVAGDCNPPDVPGVNPYTFNCREMSGDPVAAYLVPIDLDKPLGNRAFIDGTRRYAATQ